MCDSMGGMNINRSYLLTDAHQISS